MHDDILNIQRGDVAETLRWAVLQIVGTCSSDGEGTTVTSTDPRLPPLLNGLEQVLCDGLKPHIAHIWPFVSESLCNREHHADCSVATQGEILQEVRQFATKTQSIGSMLTGAKWLSRVWIVCSLRQGSIAEAMLALGKVRNEYYEAGAFLATTSGFNFLLTSLRALSDSRVCFLVSEGDYKLFPKTGSFRTLRDFAENLKGAQRKALQKPSGHFNPIAPPPTLALAPPAQSTNTCEEHFHVRCKYVTSSMVCITVRRDWACGAKSAEELETCYDSSVASHEPLEDKELGHEPFENGSSMLRCDFKGQPPMASGPSAVGGVYLLLQRPCPKNDTKYTFACLKLYCSESTLHPAFYLALGRLDPHALLQRLSTTELKGPCTWHGLTT